MQRTRFNTMTRDMLPLPKVAVSASVYVPGPRVQEAFSALEAACKAAGICRDRSRSRTPSQISPDSQAAPPEELQPDEQKDPGFQPDEEYPEGFQPDEQAYGVAPEADEQALQPATAHWAFAVLRRRPIKCSTPTAECLVAAWHYGMRRFLIHAYHTFRTHCLCLISS